MMKFLREFWKLFKIFGKKRKNRKTIIQKDFSLRSELTQLHIEETPTPPIRKKEEKIHISVGLDFGTSNTKVVYSQAGKRFRRALNFNHNLQIYPNYCLPSVAAVNPRGEILLGVEAAEYLLNKEWDFGFQRIKVCVAGKYDKTFSDHITNERFYKYRSLAGYPESFSQEKLTAIFLAYAMNKCREHISNLPEYIDTDLDIAFNICMPIEHMENNSVRKAFEDIFRKAEAMERAMQDLGENFNPVFYDISQEYYPNEMEKRVFSIPEAVAGIASYLISLRREDGLHAIVDLGAGTTDVSICNLVSPRGEAESLWYSAKNIPLGTINIERLIVDHVQEESEKRATCTCQEVHDILNSLKYQSPVLYKKAWDRLSAIRESEYYRHAWGGAYRHLKSQSKWENVEIFLSGGGSLLPFAENVFRIPWWQQIETKYPVSRLPIPEDYIAGESEAPFERMAIAYGLSIPKPSLEKYTLPNDAPDQTPPKLHYFLPDRDEIYAK